MSKKKRPINQTQNAYEKATNLAGKIGVVICVLLVVIEFISSDSVTYGLWTLYSLVYGIIWFVLAFKTGKRQHYLYGAMLLLCAVLFFVSFMRG